jgi:4-hydroxybenzoate polyprenyltransferase
MQRGWNRLLSLAQDISRWRDWGGSKVPLLLTIFFYYALLSQKPHSSAEVPAAGMENAVALLVSFVAVLSCICFSFAFGYALNDLADRHVDRLAGKRRLIVDLHPLAGGGIIALLAIAGIVSLLPFYRAPYLLALVLASYVVAALYSLPPVRFKERGWIGVMVSAAGEYAFPVLVISALFRSIGWETGLLAMLFLISGLRGELVHQLLDYKTDRQAGVQTYAVKRGRIASLWQVRWLVFPIELALLGAVLAAMLWRLPELAPFLVLYALWLPIWVYLANGLTAAFSFEGFQRQPLNDFYYVFWPTSLALLLVLQEIWLLPLLALLALWELPVVLAAPSTLLRLLKARRLMAHTAPTSEQPEVPAAAET